MHANLGVFLTHLWLKSTDRAQHIERLDLAIEEVKSALRINPRAHFGREHAHLALLEWWREGVRTMPFQEKEHEVHEMVVNALGSFEGIDIRHPDTDLVKALCGLIQMGSAQDSPDVHLLLGNELTAERDASLSYLTHLRLAELALESRPVVHADVNLQRWFDPATHRPDKWGTTIKAEIDELAPNFVRSIGFWGMAAGRDMLPVHAWFHEARQAAKGRHKDQTAFMNKQFALGKHPDTHADFWQGWVEPVCPEVPRTKLEQTVGIPLAAWLSESGNQFALVIGGLSSCVILIYVVLRVRRWKRLHAEAVKATTVQI